MTKENLVRIAKLVGSTFVFTSLLISSLTLGMFVISPVAWVFMAIASAAILLHNARDILGLNDTFKMSDLMPTLHKVFIINSIILCFTGPTFLLGAGAIASGVILGSLTALIGHGILKFKESRAQSRPSSDCATALYTPAVPAAYANTPGSALDVYAGLQNQPTSAPSQLGQPLYPPVHQPVPGRGLSKGPQF